MPKVMKQDKTVEKTDAVCKPVMTWVLAILREVGGKPNPLSAEAGDLLYLGCKISEYDRKLLLSAIQRAKGGK